MTTEEKKLITDVPIALDYSSRQVIDALKSTVARNASDAEFTLFVEMCKATGLNPFKKEIWFIKTKDAVQMMTGINGFYQIANSHPEFDGIEVEVTERDGKIEKAVAKVYRKDRSRPTTAEAYWQEYSKPYGNWKTMPRVMLSKCAESMALRKAFPQQLNGLYSAEEMPPEYATPEPVVTNGDASQSPPVDVSPEPEVDRPYEYKPMNIQTDDAKREFTRLCKEAGGVWNRSTRSYWTTREIPSLEDYLANFPLDTSKAQQQSF